MGRIQRFEDLIAWQRARNQLSQLRKLTRRHNVRRDFAFVDQVIRAARSVMANIAEGYERRGPKGFAHHLSMSNGSNAEVRSDLYAALDAEYLDEAEFQEFMANAEEVGRLITALRNAVLRKLNSAMPI